MSSQLAQWLLVISCCITTSSCVVELRKLEAPTEDAGVVDEGASDGEVTAGDQELPVGGCTVAPDCKSAGVCAALKPECVDGAWVCPDFATELADKGYADEESLAEHCDGKDNDCDGEVDEIVEENSSDCPTQGVCSDGVQRRCIDQTMVCWFKEIADYESDEKSCDSLDNDCDGDVDEAFANASEYCTDFETVGECASAIVTCEDGEWKCTPQGFYEPGIENSCDGLDNNCDGTADEGLNKLSASSCKKVGVCSLPDAHKTIATCINGEWLCNYDKVESYEKVESLCDGKDNDCDGEVDENVVSSTSECDEASKSKLSSGVCKNASPQSIAKCVGGVVQCFFSPDNVPGFEDPELSCDNLDNDCDGVVDESSVKAPDDQCLQLGVCALGSVANCSDGNWTCQYGSTDYEELESTCDGKDNDCNGMTDENTLVAPGDCPQFGIGVCNDPKVKVLCDSGNGKPICDFSAIDGYEPVELSCDSLDNDCDGLVDEDLFDVAQSDCSTLGVCGGNNAVKIVAECINNAWFCKYDNVLYFEDPEVSCDGLDNDCDGFIDEAIEDPTGGGCPTSGVCAETVKASCNNGGWICDFSNVLGFENPEISCDGNDNDCDGSIDEAVCPNLSPCIGNGQCISGICKEAPDLESTYCVDKNVFCPNQDGSEQVSVGTSNCAPLNSGDGSIEWYTTVCQQGGWNTAETPCENGACADGKCSECFPDTVACASGLFLVPCLSSGVWGTQVQCPLPTNCIDGGHGICLLHDDSKVDNGTGVNKAPTVAFAPNGTGLVVWHTQSEAGGERKIALRQFNEYAHFKDANKAFVAEFFPKATQTSPTVDYINNSVAAVAWSELTADSSSDIRIRLIDIPLNKTIAPTVVANVQTDFMRTVPHMVARTQGNGGITLVWQAQTAEGGNGADILTRSFDLSFETNFVLTPISPKETFVHSDTSNDQANPTIVQLNDKSMVVAWEDNMVDMNTWGVFGRKLDKDGAPLGDVFQLNSTAVGDQREVAVAALDSGFVAVWSSSQFAGGDVMIGMFGSDGSKLAGKSERFVTNAQTNLPETGTQHHPDVATFAGNRIVVVYEDTVTEGTGAGIYMQEFSPTLEAIGAARNVNQTVKPGDQIFPSVSASGDTEKPWVMVIYEDQLSESIFSRPMELNHL